MTALWQILLCVGFLESHSISISRISPVFKANPTGLFKKSNLRQNLNRNLHLDHFDLEI